MGGGGLALRPVVWLATCLLKIAVFEVAAQQAKLSQALVSGEGENLTVSVHTTGAWAPASFLEFSRLFAPPEDPPS